MWGKGKGVGREGCDSRKAIVADENGGAMRHNVGCWSVEGCVCLTARAVGVRKPHEVVTSDSVFGRELNPLTAVRS
jgi:hypothetical protein